MAGRQTDQSFINPCLVPECSSNKGRLLSCNRGIPNWRKS